MPEEIKTVKPEVISSKEIKNIDSNAEAMKKVNMFIFWVAFFGIVIVLAFIALIIWFILFLIKKA